MRTRVLLFTLLLTGLSAFAEVPVSGRVIDDAGEPMIGVNVLLDGTGMEHCFVVVLYLGQNNGTGPGL